MEYYKWNWGKGILIYHEDPYQGITDYNDADWAIFIMKYHYKGFWTKISQYK